MFYLTAHSTHFIYGYMGQTYGKGPLIFKLKKYIFPFIYLFLFICLEVRRLLTLHSSDKRYTNDITSDLRIRFAELETEERL